MAKTKLENIEACVFDAYGTLFDVHAAAGRIADDLGPDAEAISALWRQKQLEYTWLRSLMRSHVDFWQITGDALSYALDKFEVSERDAIHRTLMDLYFRLDAYPEVKQTLTTLRQAGLKTAILSNGEPKMLAGAVESAGIGDLLDGIHSVEDVGIYKPDPRVYQLSVDRLGVPAERICFVSMNPWDASGAAHFGFAVARLNRMGVPPERLPGDIAAEIKSLDELPPLLGIGG
ncbi:MAG: haloacid dehalogenase type II [Rhodovibrionaceae bacterium]|nr:haloacid dehalogenase type II [Rhodovibrionaceae bacterium]